MSIVTILGFFYAIFRYSKSAAILCATVLPFLYLMLIVSGSTHGRYYSAIIPLVLIFAAVLSVDLSGLVLALIRWFHIRNIKPDHVVLIVAFLLGAQSLRNAYLSSYYFSQKQNADVLQDWVVNKLPQKVNYIYFWGVPTPPSYKKVDSVFVPVDENDYLSMEELKDIKSDYIVVGSDAQDVINGMHWMNNNYVVSKAFKSEDYLWEFLGDSYASLVTKELGSYRIKEFSKPFWQALDPSFFVAKYPVFWKPRKDIPIMTYNFRSEAEISNWTFVSHEDPGSESYYKTQHTSFNNSKVLAIVHRGLDMCVVPFIKVQSIPITVTSGNWYTFTAIAYRQANERYKQSKNGFIRLDFFDKENKLLKSYVSKMLTLKTDEQVLNAAGLSPENSSYAKLSVQLNKCYEEKYYFVSATLYRSKEEVRLDTNEYPYFRHGLSKTFIWLPHL